MTYTEKAEALKAETRDALQTLWDNINHGQQIQLIKREDIKTMFDRYGVDYGGDKNG